jgi:hypothetical protein
MKRRTALLLMLVSGLYTVSAQTDLVSYGFKGRVRAVIYRIYNEAKFDSFGKYIDEKNQPYIEKAIYFDKIGNIDSVVEVLSEGQVF